MVDATSPFADAFTATELTRERRIPTSDTTPAGDPVYATVTEHLLAIIDPVSARQADHLREQAGASAVGTILLATCVGPMFLDDDVRPGTEYRMTYAGQSGIARVIARPAETLQPARDALGDILYLAWRAA